MAFAAWHDRSHRAIADRSHRWTGCASARASRCRAAPAATGAAARPATSAGADRAGRRLEHPPGRRLDRRRRSRTAAAPRHPARPRRRDLLLDDHHRPGMPTSTTSAEGPAGALPPAPRCSSAAPFGCHRHPAALDIARQILAIPTKRHAQPLVRHLTMDEISAILDVPDITSRLGVRDRAMLHLCFAAALRVSELVTAQVADLSLCGTASLRVPGKGRRERCLPLWKQTAADLRAWLAVRGENPAPLSAAPCRRASHSRAPRAPVACPRTGHSDRYVTMCSGKDLALRVARRDRRASSRVRAFLWAMVWPGRSCGFNVRQCAWWRGFSFTGTVLANGDAADPGST